MKIVLVLSILTIIGYSKLFGQYESIMYPISKVEVAKNHELKVKSKSKYQMALGKKNFEYIQLFDTSGKIIKQVRGAKSSYYEYYPSGFLKSREDSAMSPDSELFRESHYFEYEKNNDLSFYRQHISSNFKHFKTNYGKEVQEMSLVDVDAYRKRLYGYDKKGNKLFEKFYDYNGYPEKIQLFDYKDGMLVLERLIKTHNSGNYDTFTISYKYDLSKRLSSKSIMETDYILKDTSNGKRVFEATIDSFRFEYRYDDIGNLISENYFYSVPQYNYAYKYRYFSNGLRLEDLYIPANGKKVINQYEYQLFDGKKLVYFPQTLKPKVNLKKNNTVKKGLKQK